MLRDDVLVYLNELSVKYGIRFGLAGSVARGRETKRSDIDIVIDNSRSLDFSIFRGIEDEAKAKFGKKVDLVFLNLLKEDDEEDDILLKSLGFGINEFSPYKEICREVLWVG